MSSLSDLLEELTLSEEGYGRGSERVGDTDQFEALVERLERVRKIRKLYDVLKSVVEPEPCPLWDSERGSCKLGFNHGYSCTQTKPYKQVLEVLREAGVDERSAEQLIERFQRLGLVAICDPVVRRDGAAAAKGAALGALLGLLAGPPGAIMGAFMGGTAGWLVGEEERHGPKRIIFIK